MKKQISLLLFPRVVKNYKVFSVLLLLLLSTVAVHAQRESDKLKKKEKQLVREINNTKSLISKTRNSQKITIAELAIINQQISYRQSLIENYVSQVHTLNRLIEENESVIKSLQNDMVRLKKNYIRMVRYAYRHRNTYHNLLFVFASGSFNQAYLRVKYLRQLSEYRTKQVSLIKQTRANLNTKVEKLAKAKQEKTGLVVQQQTERQEFQRDKEDQQQILTKLKSEEGKLKQDLQDKERTREEIAQQIRKAIQAEIKKEQDRLIAEAKKKKKENTGSKTNTKTNTKTNNTNTKTGVNPLHITPEVQLQSDQFEANKGLLPWPVASGEVTVGFGRQPHPTIAGLVTNNDGIDIGTQKGGTVRSVFKGKVTSIVIIPNAGKCVIVGHGVYRTVYTNLSNVYVKKDQQVDTKQALGTLLTSDGNELSDAHFEIWKIDGAAMSKQNPVLWLLKR